MKLTKMEADVLFHTLNNMFGDSLKEAAQCSEICDGITRDQFFATRVQLIRKLANFDLITED